MRKREKVRLTGIGLLIIAVAGIAAATKRHFLLKDLKKELNYIPWDTKEVTWKHYFKSY